MNKKRLVSFCAALLALTLIFTAVPAMAEYNAHVQKTDAGRINLRSGPAAQHRVLATIEPGTPLEVLGLSGKWAHVLVADPNGDGTLEGYMYTDYIEYTTYDPTPSSYSGEVVYDWQGGDAKCAYPPITENTTMYVNTGNSGRLHLREYASRQARSLGLYSNGTSVTVLNRSSVWAFVYANGVYGYMMLTYLSSSPYTLPYPIVPPTPTETRYVNTGNSGRLHLREFPSQNARSLGLFPNGTIVSAADLGNGWSYVNINGMVGYMMSVFLSQTPPYNPDPPQPTQYTIKYVYSPDGSKVDLRAGMSVSSQLLGSYANGTQVRVYHDFGTWSYVYVDRKLGYMQSNRLSASPYTPPHPTNPIGTATVVHPNGSFVYLRSTRSTASLDNVLAKVPSGARVTVYERDEWYSLIKYNNIIGYMVSHFLQYGVVPAPSPTPANRVVKMIVGGTVMRSSREEGNANNIITYLEHGTLVEILLTYPDEWRYIDYNGLKGYIHGPVVASVYTDGDQTSPMMPVVPESPVIFRAVVRHPNGSFVNLRYSRSTADNSNVLVQVPSGSVVEVMEQSGNWTKLRYNGVVGYMVSTYVVRLDQEPASVPSVPLTPAQTTSTSTVPAAPITPAQPQNPSSASGSPYGRRVVWNNNSGFVYLRSSRDSSNIDNVLMKVYNGTLVDLLRDEGLWSFVSVNGTVGYMVSSYLALESQSFSSTTGGSGSSSQITPAQSTSSSSVASTPITPAQSQSASSASGSPYGQRVVRAKENGAYVFLRSSRDMNSKTNIIKQIANGTIVDVLEIYDGWMKVRVDGMEGYLPSKYLKKI